MRVVKDADIDSLDYPCVHRRVIASVIAKWPTFEQYIELDWYWSISEGTVQFKTLLTNSKYIWIVFY